MYLLFCCYNNVECDTLTYAEHTQEMLDGSTKFVFPKLILGRNFLQKIQKNSRPAVQTMSLQPSRSYLGYRNDSTVDCILTEWD